jgi:hypothetical protein
MANVMVDPTTTDGQTLAELFLAPQALPDSRAAALAEAFARYTFEDVRVKVRPMVSTSISGGYVAGFLADPTTALANDSNAKRNQVLSAPGVQNSWWDEADLPVKLVQRAAGYFTSGTRAAADNEPLLVAQAKIVLVADGDVGGVTSAFPVGVTVDWKIRFWEPIARIEAEFEDTEISFDSPTTGPDFYVGGTGTIDGISGEADSFRDQVWSRMSSYTTEVYLLADANKPPPFAFSTPPDAAAPVFAWKSGTSNAIWLSTDLHGAMTNGDALDGSGSTFSWTPDGKLTMIRVKNVISTLNSKRPSQQGR